MLHILRGSSNHSCSCSCAGRVACALCLCVVCARAQRIVESRSHILKGHILLTSCSCCLLSVCWRMGLLLLRLLLLSPLPLLLGLLGSCFPGCFCSWRDLCLMRCLCDCLLSSFDSFCMCLCHCRLSLSSNTQCFALVNPSRRALHGLT